jgi:nucleoside-diphosphate-sugar epimerase
MTAVVFGGSGFVGSAIVRLLLARGDAVRVFDRDPYPDNRVESITGDICDRDQVMAACRDADVVFQTIAIVDWRPGQAQHLYDVNVQGNRHVIEACRAEGVPRLVYTSSIDVVFDGRPIVNGDETLPYPARHLDVYGRTKMLAEQDVLAANGPDLATCALRASGVYGPGDRHRFPPVLDAVRSGQMMRMGDGSARFNHVYVDNLAHAHLLAGDLLTPGAVCAGQAYFITDDPPGNFYDFFVPYLATLGLPSTFRSLPCGLMLAVAAISEWVFRLRPGPKDKPPLITRYVVLSTCRDFYFSGEKARVDLGYVPVVTAEEAYTRTLAWLREG